MDENTNVSAEIQEVAAPETEALESAETQEVAEPAESEISTEEGQEPSRKTDQDSAFADMRRKNQELERNNKLMREALSRYFDGDTDEELSINANAYAEQRDPEEYRQEYEQNKEFDAIKAENDDLKEQLLNAQVEKMMREDLVELQQIDKLIGSLDDLGEPFLNLRLNAGLDVKTAYYACKAMELNEKVLAPDPIGRVESSKVERDYYTSEEIDNMSKEEIKAN